MRIEDMTHLNMRKWRRKNIKLFMIEDEETCNMLFNVCTVILLGGFGNTENFSVRTLRTVLKTRIEDFALGEWGSQILTVRIVRTNLGGKTPIHIQIIHRINTTEHWLEKNKRTKGLLCEFYTNLAADCLVHTRHSILINTDKPEVQAVVS